MNTSCNGRQDKKSSRGRGTTEKSKRIILAHIDVLTKGQFSDRANILT